MNSDEISKNLLINFDCWINDQKTPRREHYLQGISIQKCVKKHLKILKEVHAFECSGIGDLEVSSIKDEHLVKQIEFWKEIQFTIKDKLHPVVEGLIALDIHANDHNGIIKFKIGNFLENHRLILATTSLLRGVGSENRQSLEKLTRAVLDKENDYHYFVDDAQQYSLMIPKSDFPAQNGAQLLRSLDFNPNSWFPIKASDLLWSAYSEPSLSHLLTLFSENPRAKKRWVLDGHGGHSTLCSLKKEEYLRFNEFLEKQGTEFLYVSSCASGAKREWHSDDSSITTVLGTYSAESYYGSSIKEGFFSEINLALTMRKICSIKPFQKLFSHFMGTGRNMRIIQLPKTNEFQNDFQLLNPGKKAKDLFFIDIQRAKVENKPIDLSRKNQVCFHVKHVDVPLKVGMGTEIFPYRFSELIEVASLEVAGGDIEAYIHQLTETYQKRPGQTGLFFIRQLYDREDVIWAFSENYSFQWNLKDISLEDLIRLRQYLNEEEFLEKILPCLNSETVEHLRLLDAIIQKGGVELSEEENSFFKKATRPVLESLVKSGSLHENVVSQVLSSKKNSRYLLKCCIKFQRLDLIPDLSLFKKVINKHHFFEAIESGSISMLSRLASIEEVQFPKDLDQCLVSGIQGGEEMMIELYRRLNFSPSYSLLTKKNLFKIAVSLGWKDFAGLMMEEGKPKSSTALIEDDPLNLLIDACTRDFEWKPLVVKAIQNGWNPVETEPFGHRELPIIRLIHRGIFDLFLLLLEKYEQKDLVRLQHYSPLSAAIDQLDSRYLEVLLAQDFFPLDLEVSSGETLLCKAVKCGNIQAAELLINCHAAVDPEKPHQNSPLSWAIKTKNPQMVKILLENGAKKISRNDYSKLIEMIKEFADDEELVWQLLFLVYRKPSMYEPGLSFDLVEYFLEKGMRAQLQWVISRRDQYQQENSIRYLELFVDANDSELVKELFDQYSFREKKADLLRIKKRIIPYTLNSSIILDLLQSELSGF